MVKINITTGDIKMTLEEIKTAVRAGKKVCWKSDNYVVKNNNEHFKITNTSNGYTKGLNHKDGITMSHKEKDFFIAS